MSQPDTPRRSFKDWIARLLIRTKRIKESVYTLEELSDSVSQQLPHVHELDVPGGVLSKGELVIMDGSLILEANDRAALGFLLHTSIDVAIGGQTLYRAHIDVLACASVWFNAEKKCLSFKDCEIRSLTLKNDSYFFLESSANIVKSLTPSLFRGVIGATLDTAVGMINKVSDTELKHYLAMVADSGKQSVLDYHRAEVEQEIEDLIQLGELDYPLDENDFEEALFAELGKDIEVRDNQLVFKFH